MRRSWLFIAFFAAVMPLSGCYESSDVVLHSPGKYTGKPDSATIMHPTEEQRAVLSARFRAVQTDR